MSGRVSIVFVGDDLEAAMGRLEEVLSPARWLLGLEHDPAPPVHERGAYVLRIEWCGAGEGPAHWVRAGDLVTVDREAGTWREVCAWPIEPRPAPHLEAVLAALVEWTSRREEEMH